MRTRRIVKELNGKRNLVYFGSCGLSFDNVLFKANLQVDGIHDINSDMVYIEEVGNKVSNGVWRFTPYKKDIFWELGHNIVDETTITINLQSNRLLINFKPKTLTQYNYNIIADNFYFNGNEVYDKDLTFETYAQGNVNILGKAKRPIYLNDNPNFAIKQEAVAMSLTQSLSIIKGELKHYLNVGFPLFDKKPSKAILDAYVVRTVLNHPEITNLLSFSSKIESRVYVCDFKVMTTYGELSFSNSQTI